MLAEVIATRRLRLGRAHKWLPKTMNARASPVTLASGGKLPMSIQPGQRVVIGKTFSARAFQLNAEETVRCGYGEFVRAGRVACLLTMAAGEVLETLTDAPNGLVYAHAEREGTPYAVLLADGSFSL